VDNLDKGDAVNLIGYARVSSTDQSTDIQHEQLKEAGCSIIRTEKVSGRSRDGRTELATVLEFLRPGDCLVVVKIDRLGRSVRDVLNIVHEVEAKGAFLRVLEPAINTDGPMGKLVLTVLGMVAEMELGFIRDRQALGIAKAKAAGVYKGGKRRLDRDAIRAAKADGMPVSAIAERFGCSRQAVYNSLIEQ
jgi:DNA invertase Pin-like site-specific DNA recombinase